jgi:ribosomal protein L4
LALRSALADRFSSDCVTLLATDGFDVNKTRDMATLLFGSAKAAKHGPRTLVVYAAAEREGVGLQLTRAGSNLERVGITHTHALDVKDVLGYGRIVFTTAAFEELRDSFADYEKKAK